MNRFRLAPILLLAAATCSASGAEAPSLERIVSLPSLTGTAPAAPAWARDSRRVAFLWNDEGMPFRDVWVVGNDGAGLQRLTSLAPKHAPPPEPGQSRREMLERSAIRHDTGVGQLQWMPDSDRVVFVHRGRMQVVPVTGGDARPLLPNDSSGHSPVFSPAGERLAFIRANDLWLHDFTRGVSQPVTELGRAGIGTVPVGAFAGPDAYIRSHTWSSDGRYLAFVHIDRSEVRRVPIPAWLHGAEPLMHEIRRAYPGDRDERQRVGIYDTRDQSLKWLETGDPTARIFYEIAWSPARPELLVHQGLDVAEKRWIHIADAASGQLRTLWEDERASRVYPIFRAVWSGNGEQVRFVGDMHDHYRLYTVDADGGKPEVLTQGDFDVAATRSAATVETRGKSLYFVAAAPTPYERHLYRLEAGAEPVRITTRPGVHRPVISPDGRHVASVRSSDSRPAELYVGPADAGAQLARATESPAPDFAQYDWIEPRYATFPGPEEGQILHARIVEPRDMALGQRYPVLIGNIYSNTVRSAWDAERPTTNLQQRLALTGEYIHVQVDLRGSVGYGVDFREAFQGDWGRGDLRDLVATVDYLKTLDYVDAERIGLWGNSYGGLMVLSALFREPGLFAAGVAGAPAVDVHHFTGYDQHLTRRPDTHPGIFERGSLMDLGEDLVDPLMIIHGMHDDIVPFKTTLMLTEKLMLLGKDFDLVAMPRAPHWWAGTEHYAVYTFGKIEDFFRRHVPPGPMSANGEFVDE